MINLGRLVTDIKQIDPVWTFSHYCKIPANTFNGSTIKIKSVFNPDEKTPSLCIYFKDDKIKFKDFSTSYSGDHINLVEKMFDLNYSQSCFRIVNDYTRSVINNTDFEKGEISMTNKFKVAGFRKRNWTTNDRDFWLPFGIGSTLLEWGLVSPLPSYRMANGLRDIEISGDNIYGYFTKKGELYKIYQPKNKDVKFINVREYDAGSDHEEGNDFCVFLSSWKDALSFKDLGLKIDMKVPSSENSLFSETFIKRQKKKYKKVFTLLDADDAGKKAMLKYKELYDLDFVWLPLSKDISDSRRDHGKAKLLRTALPLIHKIIN